MFKDFKKNSDCVLLYLDTRALPLERHAELRAAKIQGYQVLLATPNPSPYRGCAIDYILKVNTGDYNESELIILDYIHRNQLNVTGVLPWKDREVILAARLGRALSLPSSSIESAENVRNKAKTRFILDQFPGLNPRYAVVNSEAEFLAALNHVGVPCVLKQAGNSGSRGMHIIHSIEEGLSIYRHFKHANKQQSIDMYHYYSDIALLEEQLIGSEHSISGVVADGEVITLGIADKKIERALQLQYENIVPSRLNHKLQEEMVSITQKIIKATGINWCGFHVDFMVTNDGIKILEIGGRLGGEMINSHLISLAQPGINPYQILIEVVQGRNPLSRKDYTRSFVSQAASRVIMPPSLGTIASIEGIEKARTDPRCHDLMQLYGIGDEMVTPEVRFKGFEIGYLIAQCEKNDDMDETISDLISHVKIAIK